jgi:hypothetical protein
MGIVPEVEELLDVNTGGTHSTDPAPREVMAKVSPGFGEMGHMLPTTEASCVGALPTLWFDEDAANRVKAVRNSVVIEKPSQAMAIIRVDGVFVMKHVIVLIEYVGKISVGNRTRGSEVLVTLKEFGEGFFDGPVTDCESIEDYGVIVRIDGTDTLSNCGAGNWVVGKPSSKLEGDRFGEEAAMVGEGKATISVSRKLAEGGADPRIGQATTEEATREF